MEYQHMSKRELRRTDLYKASLVRNKHKLSKPALLQMLQKESEGRENIVKAYNDLYPVREALNKYLHPFPSVLQLKVGNVLRIVRVHDMFKGKYTKVYTQPGLLTFKDGPQGCMWSRSEKVESVRSWEDPECKEGEKGPVIRWGRGNLFSEKNLVDVLHAVYDGCDEYYQIYDGNLPECLRTQKFLNHFITDHLEQRKKDDDASSYAPTDDESDNEDYEDLEESDEDGEGTKNSDETVTSEGYFSCEENLPEFERVIGEDMEFGERLSEYCSLAKVHTEVSEDLDTKVIPKFNEHTFLMFLTSRVPDIENLVLISRTKVGKFVLWKIADTSDKANPQDVGRAVLLETPEFTLPCGGSVGLFGHKNSAGGTKVVAELGIFLDHAFVEH